MTCPYANQGCCFFFNSPYGPVKGKNSSKGDSGAWKLSSHHCLLPDTWSFCERNITAGVALMPTTSSAGWDECERASDTPQALLRWFQMKVTVENRATLSSFRTNSTAHVGSRSDGKTVEPLRKSLFLWPFPHPSTMGDLLGCQGSSQGPWKAQVLQSYSLRLQISNKIQHDKSPSQPSGASDQHLDDFLFCRCFSIQHLERPGEPVWAREAKANQTPDRDMTTTTPNNNNKSSEKRKKNSNSHTSYQTYAQINNRCGSAMAAPCR